MKLTKAYKTLSWNEQTSRYFKMYWSSKWIQLLCLNMISDVRRNQSRSQSYNPGRAGNFLLIGSEKGKTALKKVACTQIDGL